MKATWDAKLMVMAIPQALQRLPRRFLGYCRAICAYWYVSSRSRSASIRADDRSEASLRIQSNPDNKAEFETVSNERFADYVFGSLLLHFFCVNFIN